MGDSPSLTTRVSIVVPAHNEEKNLVLLHKELLQHLLEFENEIEFEIILVNDGSSDDTWNQILLLSETDSRITGIDFTRNFGHALALEAGLAEATGDAVIMMDADLQHPPALVPVLIRTWLETGVDVVSTVRTSTRDASGLKKHSSGLFYRWLNGLSDLELNSGEADFRLVSRRVNLALQELPESPKFYRGLIPWLGYSTRKIAYDAPERLHGKSSYSLSKMIEFARLGLTSFSDRPLKGIIAIGVFLSIGSLIGLVIMLITKLFVNSEFFSSIAILVVFLILVTGVVTTFQGVVALYIVDIFKASKGRPTYIVNETTRFRDTGLPL